VKESVILRVLKDDNININYEGQKRSKRFKDLSTVKKLMEDDHIDKDLHYYIKREESEEIFFDENMDVVNLLLMNEKNIYCNGLPLPKDELQ
jgi:hypothetical protein